MHSYLIRFLLFAFLLSLIACGEKAVSTQEKPANPVPTEGFINSKDGIPIFYKKQGTGPTALVFVHGWCIDGSYFQKQMDHLDDAYTVISMDLPGHGKSGDKRQTWTMESFGNDVVSLVDGLKLSEVILVGHSMSEMIIAEAAAQLGSKVKALVGVDTYINPTETVKAEDSLMIVSSMEDDLEETLWNWMGNYFPEEGDAKVKEFILTDMAEGPPAICVTVMSDIIRYQNEGKFVPLLNSLQVPIRTVNVIPPDSTVWSGIEADFDWTALEKTGHYPMLEIPGQFNEALTTTLKELASK